MLKKKLASLLAATLLIVSLSACSSEGGSVGSGQPGGMPSAASGTAGEATVPTAEGSTTTADTTTATSRPVQPGRQTRSTAEKTATTKPKGSTANTTAPTKSESDLQDFYQRDELKGTTVKLLLWYEPGEDEKKQLDAFEEMTGATVKVELTTYDSYQTKIAGSIATGNPADAVQICPDYYPTFMTRNLVQPIDSYIDKTDPLLNFSSMDLYKWNNRYYGICGPESGDYFVVYYNKTLFDNTLGVKSPLELYTAGDWNWDTFQELCEAMTKKEGGQVTQYGFQTTQQNAFMLSTGASFYRIKDGKTIETTIKSSNAAVGWTFLKDLYKNEFCLVDSTYTSFVSGKVAMLCSGQWMVNDKYSNPQSYAFANMKDEWDWVPFPSYPDGTSYQPMEPKVWGIPREAKNPLGGYMLIHWREDDTDAVSGSSLPKEWQTRKDALYGLEKATDFSKSILGEDVWSLCWSLYDPAGDTAKAVDEWLPKLQSAADRVMKEIR